jgi:hypothetical protein
MNASGQAWDGNLPLPTDSVVDVVSAGAFRMTSDASPTMSGKDPVWVGKSSRWDGPAAGPIGDGRATSGETITGTDLGATASMPSKIAEQVAAAAAAAIEQPLNLGSRPKSGGGMKLGVASAKTNAEREMSRMIQRAQMEAEQKRSGGVNIQLAQSHAARLRGQEEPLGGWSGQTSNGRGGRSSARLSIGPEDFLGNWIDMQGNSVLVYSTDAFQMRLMASVSRPGSKDLQLGLRPTPDGRGWICGNATLNFALSSTAQLHWAGPNGRISVWMKGRL